VGDSLRLTQVIGNLLGNAAKFTDRGGEVVVGLVRHASRPVAILSIRDTGIGIDAAFLPRIFDAFAQAERGFERSRGGLGLGLALVKGIVELHGGGVSAASPGPGAGSEFVIELPMIELPAENGKKAEAEPAKSPAKRILLIEDERDSAESLKEYLELFGHTVIVANSGPEGLERATAEPPDVVVCDIGMPTMNGHIVCAELKKLPALAHTVVIALSGHAQEPEACEPDEGGFDHYLLKPVDPSRLAELVRQVQTTRPGM
jgi:two-component system CheB/CheR fusion protein